MTSCDILWQRTALKQQVSIKAFDYTPPTSKWISWNLDLEAEIWSDVWKLTVLEGTVDTWLNLSSSWTFCIHANLIQPQLLKQWASTDEIYMRSQMEKEKENSGARQLKDRYRNCQKLIGLCFWKSQIYTMDWAESCKNIQLPSSVYKSDCIFQKCWSSSTVFLKKIPLFNK